jgi:hypothetical protein
MEQCICYQSCNLVNFYLNLGYGSNFCIFAFTGCMCMFNYSLQNIFQWLVFCKCILFWKGNIHQYALKLTCKASRPVAANVSKLITSIGKTEHGEGWQGSVWFKKHSGNSIHFSLAFICFIAINWSPWCVNLQKKEKSNFLEYHEIVFDKIERPSAFKPICVIT